MRTNWYPDGGQLKEEKDEMKVPKPTKAWILHRKKIISDLVRMDIHPLDIAGFFEHTADVMRQMYKDSMTDVMDGLDEK